MPGVEDLDTRGVETACVGVGHRTDGEQDVAAGHRPAVLDVHRGRRGAAFDPGSTCTLEDRDTTRHQLLLERIRDLRVLARQHVAAARHECDLATQCVEDVDELDTGHTRADDHDVLGKCVEVVGLARDEDALAVDLCPSGHTRAAAHGEE